MALCLAFSFITCSSNAQQLIPGQEYSTGNIVIQTPYGGPSPWVNGVYQDSLTCFGWGMPGYCGPNPITTPGTNINFSYGSTYIYQEQSMMGLLPNSGTGLQVTGYNFGFTAKNGNGWDDGRLDQLNAIVRFWDTTGLRNSSNLLYDKNYNLNYKFDWTNFNFSEKFTTPLNATSIGAVQYGFIGRDNNFWAGPYGPEVTNISFSLKYTVDPCSVNVLSSPSCPGYLNAISSLTPTVVSSPIVTTTTITTTPTTMDSQPATVKVDAGGVEVSTTGTISAPDNIPQVVKDSQPQKTETEKQEERTKGTPNMALVMNTIRQVQANDRAVQASAVQNALQEVSNAISNAQEQTNMAIESNQKTNAMQQQAIVEQVAAQTTQPIMPKIDYSITTFSQPVFVDSISIRQQRMESQVEAPTQQSNFMSHDNPIKAIIEQRPNFENSGNEQKTETVKSNIQPNEAAGGKDINSIAVTPSGFELYTNLALRDVAFYKPDEVYKGQVTVDNVRALRQLSSDRLHQEMVNQQYRK